MRWRTRPALASPRISTRRSLRKPPAPSIQPSLDPQPTDALFNLNHFRMYDALLALHREGKTSVRLQINFLHNQAFIAALGDLDHQFAELRERLKNQFPFFGDDMLRTGGIGEWAAPFAIPANANDYAVWYEAQRLVAKARWRNGTHRSGGRATPQHRAGRRRRQAMDQGVGDKEVRWASSAGVRRRRIGSPASRP